MICLAFEDGYIPEVDEDGNIDFDNQEERVGEGSRPKRSSTRNVSYDGFLDSDEETSPKSNLSICFHNV
jgi:hypothetical protein